MSWCVTVNDVQERDELPLDKQEFFASQHASYPRDAAVALALAKAAGLRSATLSGARTPNPYGGDEIVDISVRGTPVYTDFLREMRELVTSGPGEDSALAAHWEALARLRERPCSHVFESVDVGGQQCLACRVYLNGTLFHFED